VEQLLHRSNLQGNDMEIVRSWEIFLNWGVARVDNVEFERQNLSKSDFVRNTTTSFAIPILLL
jgi:hypothetical protein